MENKHEFLSHLLKENCHLVKYFTKMMISFI